MNGARQPQARLLVVDDDPNILELLAANLRCAGFEVAGAQDGWTALKTARAFRPDSVVLDVLMPGLDGFEVARRMRSEGMSAPVLFLSTLQADPDKIRGLTVGGDDYVAKPFSLDEVIARVGALLRRSGHQNGMPWARGCLTFADIELDEDRHEVCKAGKPVELTQTEFNLLRYFLLNRDRIVSKTQILNHVWNYDYVGDTNVVEAGVLCLRHKVDTTEPRLIHALQGVGYVLRRQSV